MIEEEAETDDEGPKIVIAGPDGGTEYYAVFKDVAEGVVIAEQEYVARRYYVSDSSWTRDWQIAGEKKDILGYECLKAMVGDSITAWFAPEIPIADGPDTFWGLPGLILELHDVKETYVCVAIEQSDEKVKMPKAGKTMTVAEFQKFMDDDAERLEREMPTGSEL